MSWLITGGSGQLGIALSQELSERGLIFKAWSSQDLDITQSKDVLREIDEFSPSVIVNCAAWTDVDGAESNELLAYKVNCDGVKNISLAAKLCGAKLIHISTDYVFSGNNKVPWNIGDKIDPQSAYGRTKADGENCALSLYPDKTSIVRTAWLYSPWGKNFAKTMTRLAIYGDSKVKVVNDQFGQPTSATDLATQLVALGLSNTSAGIYHGTNAGQTTWFEYAEEIFKLAESDLSRLMPITSDAYPGPAKRPRYSVLSHDAWRNTSIEPMRDWQTALAEAFPAIISAVKAEG